MPSHLTHTQCYMDVYDQLPGRMKTQYAQAWERNKIFAQGHDFLLVYMFLHLPSYPKIQKKLALIEENVQEMALHYIAAWRASSRSEEATFFLYGYLIHHFLDAKLHPLIIYETGNLRGDKKAQARHLLLENMIDAYILRRGGTDPKKHKIHTLVTSNKALSAETRSIIDSSFEKTYGIPNFSELFAECNKTTGTFLKAMRYDPWGVKKILLRPLDYLLMGVFKPSILPFRFDGTECADHLNIHNEEWTHPADAAIVCAKSFDELFAEAVTEIAAMISALDRAMAGNAGDEELRSIIPDISSIHGLAAGQKREFANVKGR